LPDDGEDLDALVRRTDPDRWLASRFVADPLARADLIALYAFDHELARAGRVTSTPLLAEIRLTWWREMLDEAYEGRPVRHHPAAQALALAIDRRSLPRDLLEALIDGRIAELDEGAPAGVAESRVVHAAGRLLDPATPEHFTASQLSTAAFPAVLPLAIRDVRNPLLKRLKAVWCVARGRI
jgi:hypothetical protein